MKRKLLTLKGTPVEQQVSAEAYMYDEGVLKYRADQKLAEDKGRPSTHGSGAVLLSMVEPRLAEAIRLACDARKRGRPNVGVAKLKLFKPEVAAMIGARAVIDAMADQKKLAAMTIYVASRLEDELKLQAWEKFCRPHARINMETGEYIVDEHGDPLKTEFDPSYKNALKQIEGSQSYKYKRRVLLSLMSQCETSPGWTRWNKDTKVKVGGKIIEFMLELKGAQIIMRERYKGSNIIIATPEYTATIMSTDDRLEGMNPRYIPSLMEPPAWTSETGPYIGLDIPIVKRKTSIHGSRRKQDPTKVILDSLSAVQRTPWEVNDETFEVFDTMWWRLRDRPMPGVPRRMAYPPVPRPEGLPPLPKKGEEQVLTEYQEEILQGYKQAKARNIEAELKRSSQINTFKQTWKAARKLRGREEPIWLPANLDWRSRMYTVPIYLSNQGASPGRGLLRFKNGLPFKTAEALRWWKISAANHWGEDKITLDQRVEWIDSHMTLILLCGEDPLSNSWWEEADSPWEFLSFCLEAFRWDEEGRSLDFISHLPVGMDSTCSGIQLLSASMRCEEGGRAVNLTNTKEKQDIYTDVAEAVKVKLAKIAEDTEAEDDDRRHARMWLKSGLLTRKAVKKQTMCWVYGSQRHGMQDQLMEYLNDIEDDGSVLPFDNPFRSALFLTHIIHPTISEVVKGAADVMKWIRSIAKQTAEKGLPMRWTNPVGFLVTQSYRNINKITVKTQISGNLRLVLNDYGKEISKTKQVSGSSPNWTHSLDAALLMNTVYNMESLGLEDPVSYSMVHDCFAVSAQHAPVLAKVVRQAFVTMFQEHDVLAELKSDIEKDTGLTLDDPPPMGSLRIEDVEDSEYFFS